MINEKVIKEIEKEIERIGFIEDSDGVYQLFEIAEKYNAEYDDIIEYLKENYNYICEVDETGMALVFYYRKNLKFESLKEFKNYFELGE